jgi:hypothetical protein
VTEELPKDRCDFCDNGIEPDWAFCPHCSRVLDLNQVADRATPTPELDAVVERLRKRAESVFNDTRSLYGKEIGRAIPREETLEWEAATLLAKRNGKDG